MFLYEEIIVRQILITSVIPNAKSYFAFKPNMLSPRDQSLQYVLPLWIHLAIVTDIRLRRLPTRLEALGYNPTFDLWSTGGVTTGNDQSQWIKNW